MYQSIGINLSKSLDAATKRIKIRGSGERFRNLQHHPTPSLQRRDFCQRTKPTNGDREYGRHQTILEILGLLRSGFHLLHPGSIGLWNTQNRRHGRP